MSNDFWKLSTGESVATTETTYEAPSGGGDYVFAEGTKVKALIEEVRWNSYQGGEEYINLRVSVIAPETDLQGVKISNRKLFFKLWVNGDVANSKTPEKIAKKSDNAKRLLGAINANAGNKLPNGKPTDEQFAAALSMKTMVFRLGVYDMTESGGKIGNWLSAVAPSTAPVEVSGQYVPKVGKVQATPAAASSNPSYDDSDSIPF